VGFCFFCHFVDASSFLQCCDNVCSLAGRACSPWKPVPLFPKVVFQNMQRKKTERELANTCLAEKCVKIVTFRARGCTSSAIIADANMWLQCTCHVWYYHVSVITWDSSRQLKKQLMLDHLAWLTSMISCLKWERLENAVYPTLFLECCGNVCCCFTLLCCATFCFSGLIMAIVLCRENAISHWRALMGNTKVYRSTAYIFVLDGKHVNHTVRGCPSGDKHNEWRKLNGWHWPWVQRRCKQTLDYLSK